MKKIITSIPLKKNDEAVTADSQNQKNIQTTSNNGTTEEDNPEKKNRINTASDEIEPITGNASEKEEAALYSSEEENDVPLVATDSHIIDKEDFLPVPEVVQSPTSKSEGGEDCSKISADTLSTDTAYPLTDKEIIGKNE